MIKLPNTFWYSSFFNYIKNIFQNKNGISTITSAILQQHTDKSNRLHQ